MSTELSSNEKFTDEKFTDEKFKDFLNNVKTHGLKKKSNVHEQSKNFLERFEKLNADDKSYIVNYVSKYYMNEDMNSVIVRMLNDYKEEIDEAFFLRSNDELCEFLNWYVYNYYHEKFLVMLGNFFVNAAEYYKDYQNSAGIVYKTWTHLVDEFDDDWEACLEEGREEEEDDDLEEDHEKDY